MSGLEFKQSGLSLREVPAWQTGSTHTFLPWLSHDPILQFAGPILPYPTTSRFSQMVNTASPY